MHFIEKTPDILLDKRKRPTKTENAIEQFLNCKQILHFFLWELRVAFNPALSRKN